MFDIAVIAAFFAMVLLPCVVAVNSSVEQQKSPMTLIVSFCRAGLRRIL